MTAEESKAHASAHPARTGEPPESDLVDLQRRLSGEVLMPDSAGYETARQPPVYFRHSRPRAIVRCAVAADVAETLDLARRAGVRVAARSGGHCLAGRSSIDGIVIDLTSMQEVAVSGATATVGAGTRLGQLYDRLHEHDMALPAGCGETVGIAGLTLGGGIGILGRKYGLTCDRLRAANVVLADGQVVDCDDSHHPDLFWALRGAGGAASSAS